jgi:hypothetical protein
MMHILSRRRRRRPPYDGDDSVLRFPFPVLRDYPAPQSSRRRAD